MATGEVRRPARLDQVIERISWLGATIDDVGAIGISMGFANGRMHGTETWDWRTGAALPEPGWRPEAAREAVDLDDPAGVQTMCDPIRRPAWDDYGDKVLGPIAYAKPYAVDAGKGSGPVRLRRCGSSTSIAIGGEWPAEVLALGSDAVTVSSDNAEHTYLIGCGTRLTWPALKWPATSTATHVRGAAILSDRNIAGAWRIRRVPLDGACDRARAALRVEVSGAGRPVRAAARAATFADAATGATAAQVTGLRGAAPTLRLAAGGKATVRSGRALGALRWRAGGAWKAAKGSGRRWTLAAPHLRSARTVTLRAAYRGGGTGTFALRAQPAR